MRFLLPALPQPAETADRADARMSRGENRHVLRLRFGRLDSGQQGFLRFEALPETPAQGAARWGEAAAPPRPSSRQARNQATTSLGSMAMARAMLWKLGLVAMTAAWTSSNVSRAASPAMVTV